MVRCTMGRRGAGGACLYAEPWSTCAHAPVPDLLALLVPRLRGIACEHTLEHHMAGRAQGRSKHQWNHTKLMALRVKRASHACVRKHAGHAAYRKRAAVTILMATKADQALGTASSVP